MTIALIVLAIFILLFLRVPIAFAILLPCVTYVMVESPASAGTMLQRFTSTLDSFPLLAVPLFILVGYVAEQSGMAARLIDAITLVTKRLKGNIGYANVLGSFTFSWMSGSATADAAAMGSVMMPAMKRAGYKPGFSAGLTATSTMIGPLIPPSIGAVLFGVLSGTSIATMFVAGVVPGLLVTIGLLAYVFFYVRKNPPAEEDIEVSESSHLPGWRILLRALPVLFAPVVILGGILAGIMTPTEAAGVGALYLIVVATIGRWMSFSGLRTALERSVTTTGRVMIIASAGGILAYVMAREGASRTLTDVLQSLSTNPWVFILLVNIFLLLLGMFLESTAALLITVPLLLPIASAYDIDPAQFGIIVLLNLSMGLLTPPVGLVLHVISDVGNMDFWQVVRGVLAPGAVLLVVLMMVSYIPLVTTGLPRALGM
ncbi:TRAP transporter large permease [Ornithinimicrobium sp. Y1694]|uniref:TRAP transporter large permease n=1 Tax=Ornithinimicrobium sp. Y1694 TaxID=3418590 RepID=UPI003CF6AAB9